jgi:hypothetical protein
MAALPNTKSDSVKTADGKKRLNVQPQPLPNTKSDSVKTADGKKRLNVQPNSKAATTTSKAPSSSTPPPVGWISREECDARVKAAVNKAKASSGGLLGGADLSTTFQDKVIELEKRIKKMKKKKKQSRSSKGRKGSCDAYSKNKTQCLLRGCKYDDAKKRCKGQLASRTKPSKAAKRRDAKAKTTPKRKTRSKPSFSRDAKRADAISNRRYSYTHDGVTYKRSNLEPKTRFYATKA